MNSTKRINNNSVNMTLTNSRPVSAISTKNNSVDITPINSRPVSSISTVSSLECNNPFGKAFKAFAKFGDCKSTGDTITLSNSDKWFKQAKVIDGKKLTTVDTGIYFRQIAKTKKALTQKDYLQFLEIIAKNKKIDVNEIKDKLSQTGSPTTTKTTSAQINAAVARLTDHTRYTGSHKHRFDETGKGRGRAGRVDIKTINGIVNEIKVQK